MDQEVTQGKELPFGNIFVEGLEALQLDVSVASYFNSRAFSCAGLGSYFS